MRFESTGSVNEKGHGKSYDENHDDKIAAVANAEDEMDDSRSEISESSNLG